MAKKKFNDTYFLKNATELCIPENQDFLGLEIIVTIPAYKEEDLISSLLSIKSTGLSSSQYLILILINCPESTTPEWKKYYEQQADDINLPRVHVAFKELPDKTAGVGMARKILMDSAAKIFHDLNKPDGVILAYDADCSCSRFHQDKVLNYFNKNPLIQAASIYYEHNLEETENELIEYITDYELHLRVYINWKKHIGLPYAYQTIGSSMAVRAGTYTRVGGMNKRKAGEDFYFLHKLTNGNEYGEILSTTVYPSSRESDRVPFGTGRAIQEALKSEKKILTYNPQSFLIFKKLIDQLPQVYEGKLGLEHLNKEMHGFLNLISLSALIQSCKKNTSTYPSFKKRFYSRIDAFMFMKYLHHMRDKAYPNVSPLDSGNELFKSIGLSQKETSFNCLLAFRKWDKSMKSRADY